MKQICLAGLCGLLVACGARTELEQFGPGDASLGDAGVRDAGLTMPPPPGTTLALYSGNTSFDGTSWGRPYSCGDGGGNGYFYSIQTFTNPTPFLLRVEVLVDWDFDGFLHVYESPFVPDRPSLRCLDSNDDNGSTRSSRVAGISIPAGGAIDLVLSSWAEGSTGNYDAFVITQ